MIITIAGTAGSGKSTIAKKLIEKLNAKRIYVGGIRRELAREKGMTLEELNDYGKTHPETDVNIDKASARKARDISKEGQTVVVEGRTQFYFLPESIKLYIKVDPLIAAKRIFNETKNKDAKAARNEKEYTSVEDLANRIKLRTKEDTERYIKYYGINDTDPKHYDFVLDTGDITANEATEKVMEFIESKK